MWLGLPCDLAGVSWVEQVQAKQGGVAQQGRSKARQGKARQGTMYHDSSIHTHLDMD